MTIGPEVIKLFSCSTQLSMKFVLLINLKLLTIANSSSLNTTEKEFVMLINLKLLTIANSFLLNIAEHEICPNNKSQISNNC